MKDIKFCGGGLSVEIKQSKKKSEAKRKPKSVQGIVLETYVFFFPNDTAAQFAKFWEKIR